jgi:hypothetical protein
MEANTSYLARGRETIAVTERVLPKRNSRAAYERLVSVSLIRFSSSR